MIGKSRVRGRRTRNRLGVEPLEARRLLAGDVVTSLVGSGVLRLLGDASDNFIQISAADDLVTIAGIDTTIQGPVEFSLDKIQRLLVRLGDGNDGLRIGGHAHDVTVEESGEGDHDEPLLLFPGNVYVDMGDGDDQLKISFVEIGGSLIVVAGLGNDAVDIGRGPGYGGEDHDDDHDAVMTVEPAADDNHDDDGCGGDHGDAGPPPDVSVAQHVRVDTGLGDDAVKVGFTHVMGHGNIDTDAGQDVVVVGRGPLFRRDGTTHGGVCEEMPDTVYGLEALNEVVKGLEVVNSEHTEGGCGGGDDGHEEGGCGGGDEGHEEGGPPPDVHIEGYLSIETGVDSDAVSVAFTRTDGHLRIDTSSGEDLIVTGRGPLFGQHGGGGGNGGGAGGGGGSGACGDHAAASNEATDSLGPVASTGGHNRRPVDLRVGGSLLVRPGDGDDMVALRNTRVATRSMVKDHDGKSLIATLNFRGNEAARFHTGSEDDTVALLASCFAGDLAVKTGNGNDSVGLEGTSIGGAFQVYTEAGNDQLVIQSCSFGNLVIARMGRDGDTLAARRNVFAAWGILNGGPGSDDLYFGTENDANEFAAPLSVHRFALPLEEFPYDAVFAELDDMFGAFLPG